jgi:hypothetical protein
MTDFIHQANPSDFVRRDEENSVKLSAADRLVDESHTLMAKATSVNGAGESAAVKGSAGSIHMLPNGSDILNIHK